MTNLSPKAFKEINLKFEPIKKENRSFEKIDIRFVKDGVSILIETKQNFNVSLGEIEKIKGKSKSAISRNLKKEKNNVSTSVKTMMTLKEN